MLAFKNWWDLAEANEVVGLNARLIPDDPNSGPCREELPSQSVHSGMLGASLLLLVL
jgi:hypothetical protein